MKFKIIIEETIDQEFIVYAKTPEKAFEIAREKYEECEFVLDNSSCCGTTIAVYDKNNKILIDYTDI